MGNIETFLQWVKESDNIVFFGGAGVSTESGIPDFRSKDGLYDNRDIKVKDLMEKLSIKLIGHYRYYGISYNSKMLANFRQRTIEYLFKVLNRRSNRRSYNWEGFTEMLRYYKLPYPKIYVSLFD